MRARSFLGLSVVVVLAGCSSDPPKVYGPVYGDDAGKDGAANDAAVTDGAGGDGSSEAGPDASSCAATTAVVAAKLVDGRRGGKHRRAAHPGNSPATVATS